MPDAEDLPIEFRLLKDVVALDLQVLDTKVEHFMDNTHVKIVLQDDPEVLSSCAWSLIYALGVLSFADARPRGDSEMHFQDKDDWTAGDLLQHLRYEQGRLHFHADYVRGRCVKTTIDIDREGRIVLETQNRGESATRWIAQLQGKKALVAVSG